MEPKMNSGHSNGSTSDMSSTLMGELKNAVNEGEQMFKGAVTATANELASARTNLEATAHEARTRYDDARALIAQKAKLAADVSLDYVKENPWKTAGIVAVIGLVAGIFLNRRS